MVDASTGRSIEIDGRVIDDSSDCFVIAEIGHNHQGSLEKAKQLFEEAKACGADAVKLQKRDNSALFTKEMLSKPYENENSFGPTYGKHRDFLELGRSDYLELKAFASDLGISFFATAFDHPSVDFLEEINLPVYKVASADLRNIPLLKHVASTGRPLILSTGGANLDDVLRAYDEVFPINHRVVLLQCTASYPVEWDEMDLRVIETYRETFPQSVIGLSAHDNGIAMAVAAYVLGARVIEKHFTLNRAMRGSDHAFSLEPVGLRKLVRDLRRVRVAMGDGSKRMYQSEVEAITKMAKKLVASRDLPAGHVLADGDLTAKSPGDGLPPSELPRLIGRRLRHPLAVDSEITTDAVEDEEVSSPISARSHDE